MDEKGGKKENEKDNVLTLPFQRVDFAVSTCCVRPFNVLSFPYSPDKGKRASERQKQVSDVPFDTPPNFIHVCSARSQSENKRNPCPTLT